MTVLIVDALAANEGRRKFSRDAIGVGSRLLAGICERNGNNTRIIRAEDTSEIVFCLKKEPIEAILISAMTVDKIATERVLKIIRKSKIKANIFLGGPILSDIKILEDLDISAGIRGEGEIILQKLLDFDFHLDSLTEVQDSLIKITRIKDKFLIEQKSLSSSNVFEDFQPSTSRIIDYTDYWFSKVYVEITRGCSNYFRGSLVKNYGNCSDCGNCEDPDTIITDDCPENIPPGCGFCSVPSTFGPPRSKSVDLVVKEVKELLNLGVRRIILSSPGFFDYFRSKGEESVYSPTQPPANLDKIEELLSKLSKIRDSYDQICSISIENVKPSLVTSRGAELIGKYLLGTAISIGCETFDNNHSIAIGRPSSSDKALEAAKLFKRENIDPQIYLIHSLPGETVASLNVTRKIVVRKLKDYAEKITVYKYLPLPNSPFTITNTPLPPDRHLLNQVRELLKEEIVNFNREKKKELLGKEIPVIVAEKDINFEDHYISYPIFSGPAVSIHSTENIIGKTVQAKITNVLSDRLVKARII